MEEVGRGKDIIWSMELASLWVELSWYDCLWLGLGFSIIMYRGTVRRLAQ
jgi:hypothetical protein